MAKIKKIAVLTSSHLEIARIDTDELDWVYCMAYNPEAKDLLKVITTKGTTYWCDEIEFIFD
jgi:hypothetical protein